MSYIATIYQFLKLNNYCISSTETGEDVVDVLLLTLPNLASLTAAGNPFYQDVIISHVLYLYCIVKRSNK